MAHALAAFDEHPAVDEIVVLMHPDHLAAGTAVAGEFGKVSRVVPGGQTRSASTRAALGAVEDPEALMVVHDAARPLLTARMVDDCLSALGDHDAVGTVIESVDTMWEVDAEGRLVGIPARATLRRVQTPQAFRVAALRAAYDAADQDPEFEATDDCAVVFRYTPEVPVALVPGDERNLKVTTSADIRVVEQLLGC